MGSKPSVESKDSVDMGLGSIFSPPKEEDAFEQCWPKLSYRKRITGWIVCSVIGWVLSLMGTITLALSDSIVAFAVLYSIGQIINIVGSCFLSTPKGQWKAMKKKERRIASIIYISSIIATLVVAFATKIKGLVFLFLVIQMAAYYWYMITFIPWGQKIVKKLCCSCF